LIANTPNHAPKGTLGLAALDHDTVVWFQWTALSIWWYKISPNEEDAGDRFSNCLLALAESQSRRV